MNIFLTGATGFIGRALILRLQQEGHHIVAYVRNEQKARSLLGKDCSVLGISKDRSGLQQALENADAVINLAGEPLLGGRWDEKKRASIRSSRIDFTNSIVDHISEEKGPKVFISTSAVGVYGDGGSTELTEEAASGTDFLAEICRDWESAALRARDVGCRVVRMRIGVVLGRQGGALAQMLLPFRFGLGGPIGSGDQFVPWIHLQDLVDLFVKALSDNTMSGAFNATAPTPVTFTQFAKALGKQIRRPAILPLPSFAVKALFGEASVVLLNGQRAVPAHAEKMGFKFQFNRIEEALKDLLENDFITIGPCREAVPNSDYLARNSPSYVLKAATTIDRPIEEVFSFFSSPENLGLITPAALQFRITALPEEMNDGAIIDYTLKLNGIVPLKWRTRIENWKDGELFVDAQLRGPYDCWWHEHRFKAEGNKTVMTDTVYYAPPVGLLGRVANALFIEDQLKEIFGYRSSVLRLRFGNV